MQLACQRVQWVFSALRICWGFGRNNSGDLALAETGSGQARRILRDRTRAPEVDHGTGPFLDSATSVRVVPGTGRWRSGRRRLPCRRIGRPASSTTAAATSESKPAARCNFESDAWAEDGCGNLSRRRASNSYRTWRFRSRSSRDSPVGGTARTNSVTRRQGRSRPQGERGAVRTADHIGVPQPARPSSESRKSQLRGTHGESAVGDELDPKPGHSRGPQSRRRPGPLPPSRSATTSGSSSKVRHCG